MARSDADRPRVILRVAHSSAAIGVVTMVLAAIALGPVAAAPRLLEENGS
jgi:hypothetical protein